MKLLPATFALLLPLASVGSGVVLSNTEVLDAQHIRVDVQWQHSWRTADTVANPSFDAVWLFVKFKKDQGDWMHRHVNSDLASHQQSNPDLEIIPSNDGLGLFLQRNQVGTGQASATVTIELAEQFWNGNFQVRVFALEMVNVPESPFWLGDSVSANSFAGQDGAPFLVDSEAAIPVGNSAGQLSSATANFAPAADLPANYPKGFRSFYAMKYEISQQQYADFLNSLTVDQQAARTAVAPFESAGTIALTTSPNSYRNGLVIQQPATATAAAIYACDGNANGITNEADDGQNRACNFLNWNDLSAYLDWAGLRPLTELEFEKLARGADASVAGGFVWGTAEVTDANNIDQDGLSTETAVDLLAAGSGLASHGYIGPQGPLRCGFAGGDSTNQFQIGASPYGILELSGNLWEQCVTVNAAALQFAGTNGDGVLTAGGATDIDVWTQGIGGVRGGGWNSGIGPVGEFRDLAISDRWYAGDQTDVRRNTTGGRGGRYLNP